MEEIEKQLGKPSEFVFTTEKLSNLRRWAILKGLHPLEVHSMTGIALTNLYCKQAATEAAPTKLTDEAIAEMFVRILSNVHVEGFNANLTRLIAREEMSGPDTTAHIAQVAKIAAQQAFEALPPKAIVVHGPNGFGAVKGQPHYITEKVIKVVALNHAAMLIGPAGCGKTTIGEHVAQGLNLPFFITNSVGESFQLTGFIDGHGRYHTTPFRQAFEFGGVWLADELDAWDAGALLVANSALANGFASFPDRQAPVARHPDFRVIATANTFGNGADRVYVGRNELDGATLDRFAMILVDYDTNIERRLCAGRENWLRHVHKIREAVQEKKIRHIVSTRAIASGAQALNAGLTWNEVNEMYLLKGMSASDRKKIDV